jgi:hypothetical protein
MPDLQQFPCDTDDYIFSGSSEALSYAEQRVANLSPGAEFPVRYLGLIDAEAHAALKAALLQFIMDG